MIKTVEFDKSVFATYIRLRDSKILESEELDDGVVADFDADDNLVGLEILNTDQRSLEQLKSIGYQFSENDRVALRELFGKFAAAF